MRRLASSCSVVPPSVHDTSLELRVEFPGTDRAAKDDWKAGRFPTVPGDETAFVPLPE
jgi:hypothetical protein